MRTAQELIKATREFCVEDRRRSWRHLWVTLALLTDPRRLWGSLSALVCHFVLSYLLYRAGGATLVVYPFLLPLFIATAIGGYLFYIQHNFPDVVLKPREEWDYTIAALRSSSYM